jgi:glycosyltransferase involved in cell wall biosynthesis
VPRTARRTRAPPCGRESEVGGGQMPRVSVIIPVFNGAKTVAQAIDSVLAQTFRDFEIVAVDDGSRDASVATLKGYGDKVTVLEQQNRGPSSARNLGMANSCGEYLGFLDADDWWQPELLARMLPPLERNPDCVLAYCDLQLADSLGRPLPTALAAKRAADPPTVRDMLDALWPIMPSGVLVRRRVLEAVGGFPERLRAFEDVYLWLLLREQGTFAHVAADLAVWRFAHFPDPLKASGGQEEAGRIFRAMVRERYGVDPVAHVRARERAPRSILGYLGLDALARGDRTTARRAFLRALRIDPLRPRNYLRLARTFLPAGVARALSGRSGRAA